MICVELRANEIYTLKVLLKAGVSEMICVELRAKIYKMCTVCHKHMHM